jgi:Gpi18-like mannosyltransferase
MPFNWFYANLYYTDSVSTLFVLMALMFQKEGKLVKSGLIGFLAVLARQTNIVWIFGFSCLALLGSSKSSLFHLVKSLWVQILLGFFFVIFLKCNKGSVVLGRLRRYPGV